MYLLFEDAGKFLGGRILSEADNSAQVELDSGKRTKVKAANMLLKFEKPSPAALLEQAETIAAEIDLDIAWEFAPDDDFGFADLAKDYFSADTDAAHQVAALLKLHAAPYYFRRAGKGRFKKATQEQVQLALAGIEKKRLLQEQIDGWAQALVNGQCPEPIREQLYKILFKPDKNAAEYKAVVEASRAAQLAPLVLLQKAGAIGSAYEFHWQRFLFDQFPKGIGFPAAIEAPEPRMDLALAPVQAFSIDDSQTTEIDDALSLQGLGTGHVTLGVHIAAPALAISPDDALDGIARQRLSTVYMPGAKITMLPDAVVQKYTLDAGRANPAVSLYVTYNEETLEVETTESKLELVNTAYNLRHDKIEHLVTQEWLQAPSTDAADSARNEQAANISEHDRTVVTQLHPQLAFLHRLAQTLKARREEVRGKPENFSRPDYNFRIPDKQGDFPKGDETVEITTRKRGSPLDLIVAEAMIVANSTWGAWLATLGVPAIYRSQYSLAPGIKVRMGLKPQRHAGIGVECYAWSTSPLRRYVDLVNQWQIIAAIQNGQTAALAAPFKPKDTTLFAIIGAFDAAYSSYNRYQNDMERFWTLRYIEQNAIAELDAAVIREAGDEPAVVRADTLPLVMKVMGAQDMARGARVRVRLGAIDFIALDINATVIARIDNTHDDADKDNTSQDDDEDEALSSTLDIAVDLNEEDSSTTAPNSQPVERI